MNLPGFSDIDSPATKFSSDPTAGAIITVFGRIALFVGAFLMFFWALWGVFDYLKAEGNKESLAKARKKILWAITGFIILVLSFFVSSYLQQVVLPGVDLESTTPATLKEP